MSSCNHTGTMTRVILTVFELLLFKLNTSIQPLPIHLKEFDITKQTAICLYLKEVRPVSGSKQAAFFFFIQFLVQKFKGFCNNSGKQP